MCFYTLLYCRDLNPSSHGSLCERLNKGTNIISHVCFVVWFEFYIHVVFAVSQIALIFPLTQDRSCAKTKTFADFLVKIN